MQLSTREKEMEGWRKERDTLVSALEVQLKKLLMSNAEKDKQIQNLQSINTPQTPEVGSIQGTSYRVTLLYIRLNEVGLCNQL